MWSELMKKIYYKYEEIINYLIFGILTTIISVITYLFFANIIFSIKNDLTIQISNVLSWICAVTFAYITNRKYVFKSKIKGKKQIKEAMNFFLSRIFSLIVDMLMMYILFSIIHMDDTIAKLLVQIVVVILNYLLSKIIVFKKNNNKEI